MKKNGLWVIAFVIVALMVLTVVNPLSINRTEEIDDSTYTISNTPPDNPELGDLWFDTTLDEMNIYNGFVWQNLVPTVSGAGYSNHVAKHYWGGIDPISFHKLSAKIRVASEFADSGSGTSSDPYLGAVQNAIDDLPSGKGIVFIGSNEVHRVDKAIYMVSTFHSNITILGSGGSSLLKAKDQATTTLSQNVNNGDTVIHVVSTDGFVIGEWIEFAICGGGVVGDEEANYIDSIDSSAKTIALTNALTYSHAIEVDVFSTWSVIWVNGVSDVTLSNFAIDGNRAKWDKESVLGCNHQYEIDEHSCRNLRIENIDIVNSKRIGIRLLAGTESVIVTGCYLKDCSNAGIAAQSDFDECIISNNRINGATTKGIECEGADHVIIEGNIVESTEEAIFLYGTTNTYITVSNNVVYEDIRIYRAKYVDVIGNVLNNTVNGISIGGVSAEYSEHISVVGNTIYSLQGIGLASYTKYVTIQGNTIHGTNPANVDCYGVYVGSTATYNTISGNTIFEARYGLKLYSGHNVILSNSFASCGHSTIYDQISDSTNIIRANDGYVTEKSGSATMLNGQTSITVTHGMDVTPTSITVTGNHSEVSACWIVNITSTQFEIWVSAAVSYDRVVYWYAEAR